MARPPSRIRDPTRSRGVVPYLVSADYPRPAGRGAAATPSSAARRSLRRYGCAALARALLRNGVLERLSLAANLVDAKGCEHLSEVLRLSGTLKALELENNPRIGSVGAWWLGEAMAGGSLPWAVNQTGCCLQESSPD